MTKTEVCTTVLSHVFHLPQFLSLSDGDEKRPLALSAIPTEIRQGEEHPVSTVSPLNTLPEVRTTNNPSAPTAFTPHSPHSPCHPHSKMYQFSSLMYISSRSCSTGEAATTGEVGRCNHGSGALPHTVQRRLWPPAVGPLNRHSQDTRAAAQNTQVSQVGAGESGLHLYSFCHLKLAMCLDIRWI